MNMTTETHEHPGVAARDMAARAAVAVGLLAVGLIHVIDSVGKYTETRYLFWMYIGLILTSIAIAGALVYRASQDKPGGSATGADYVIASLKIPQGAEIISAVAADGQLTVTYRSGPMTSVRIFDG